MSEKNYCVYMHTSPNGKVYIGITCQRPTKRWQNGRGYLNSHNKHFYNAIQRYGWDNFQHEILHSGLTKEEAEAQEILLIAEHNATDPAHGYNTSRGGSHNGRDTAETRRKKAESKQGEKNPMYGKHIYYGSAAKLSGPDHPMYGRLGVNNPRYGMKHSPEAIEKMRENSPNSRAVMCVETGDIYQSAEAAGRALGVAGNGIAGCCKGKPHYNTAAGFHWRWAENV